MKKLAPVFLALFFAPSLVLGAQTMSFDRERSFSGPMAGVVGTYSYYNQANLFKNPAVMSLQPNKWEITSGVDTAFGLKEQSFPLCLGYMGMPSGVAFGFAYISAYHTAESFKMTDVMGSEGTDISPRTFEGKLAMACQFSICTIGIGGGVADEGYGTTYWM